MLHKAQVNSGRYGRKYLLTHRFYDWDPFECQPVKSGNASVLNSPYINYFFQDCFDDINYPQHLWDLLSQFGEIAGMGTVPSWFTKDHVIDQLVQLTKAGHIKIWEVPNRYNTQIKQTFDFVPVSTSSEESEKITQQQQAVKSNQAAQKYKKAVEKEKAQEKDDDLEPLVELAVEATQAVAAMAPAALERDDKQAKALIKAAQDGTPFCEECEKAKEKK